MNESLVLLFDCAGILSTGWLVGRFRNPHKVKPVLAICGCGHHLSMHDPQTGRCNHSTNYSHGQHGKFPCGCRQYVGAKPVDSFFNTDVNWIDSVMKVEKPKGRLEGDD